MGISVRADEAATAIDTSEAGGNPPALHGVDGHAAGNDALYLFGKGLFLGDENGNANLDNPVTRAEAIALLLRCFYTDDGQDLTDIEPFADVPDDAWYYDVTRRARVLGLTVGDGNNHFLPGDNVTREQVALMLQRQTKIMAMFITDISDVPPEYVYYDAINYVVSYGVMDANGGFRPTQNATRGEVVSALATILRSNESTFGVADTDFSETGHTPTATPAPTPTRDPIPVPDIHEVSMINMTWQQMYRKGVPYPDVPMPGVNVISPTWFSITRSESEDKEADLTPLDGGFKLQSYASADYMQKAHNNGMQVWPMFKRDDKLSREQVSAFLNNPSARKASIDKIVSLADTYGFEGINVDFEYMFESDKDAFTNYMQELADALREKGLTLSIDVTHYDPTSPSWSLPYDRTALGKLADYIVLMAYDEYGAGSSVPGPVASLPWTESIVKLTLKEVPPEKLILGIPLYTRIWQLDSTGKVVKSTAVGFASQEKAVTENKPAITFDEKNGLNLAQWSDNSGSYKLWLEDDYSIARRIFLAQSLGLAGVASWSSVFAAPDTWTLINNVQLGL